jgi:flavin reductase (DIM6/NTAB) family NADH-FMN oxidoreductase RutF/DNA-binding IclR family transcriptional regulator
MSAFDQRELRDVLGAYLTGVTVVTTVDQAGRPHGVTANSFSSVSLDPPLVLWSQALAAKSFPVFRDGDRFVVNILAEDQVEISNRFAKAGADKFAGVKVRSGLEGLPILEDCSAHLECVKIATYPGGDHAVFLGRVERIHRARRNPLAFGGGKYMVAQAYDLGVEKLGEERARFADLHAVRIATAALPEICATIQQTTSIAVWGNLGPTVIRWEPSCNPVSKDLRTGVVLDVVRSTAGLLFAAFLPEEITAGITEKSLQEHGDDLDAPTAQELRTRLDEIRQQRMSRSDFVRASVVHGVRVTAFSAPVFDADGLMVLSLTVTARSTELRRDWDGPVPQSVRRAADSLSSRLGHTAKTVG